jgi:hypothetical protein
VFVELALAWALVWLSVPHALGALAQHPDGVDALWSDGARGLLDLLLQNAEPLTRTALLLGGCAFAYGFAALPISAAIAHAVCATQPLGVRSTLLHALKRTPTIAGLAVCALCCTALASLLGIGFFVLTRAATRSLVDERVRDLCALASCLPAMALVILVDVAHDAARVFAAGAGGGVVASLRAGVRRVARSPATLVGQRAVAFITTLALTLAGAIASAQSTRPAVSALVGAAVAQLAFHGARVVVRAWWLASVARPWRDSAA